MKTDKQESSDYEANQGNAVLKIWPIGSKRAEEELGSSSSCHLLVTPDEDSTVAKQLKVEHMRKVSTSTVIQKFPFEGGELEKLAQIGQVEPKSSIELLREERNVPLHVFKCVIVYTRHYINRVCLYMVRQPWFETLLIHKNRRR